MGDFWDCVVEVVFPVAVIAVVFLTSITGLAVLATFAIDRPSCYASWKDSGLHAQWSFYGGCRVSADGKKWITDDAYVSMHKHVVIAK